MDLTIMQQLEEGTLDIDAALALLERGTPAIPTPAQAPAEIRRDDRRGVRRTAAGKLILTDLSAAPAPHAAVSGLPSIRLKPLDAPAAAPAPIPAPAAPASPTPAPQSSERAVSPPRAEAATVIAEPQRGAAHAVVAEPPAATPPAPAGAAQSAVVLSFPAEEIAVVALEDREHHNMFSPAFGEGLKDAFSRIAARPATKVVVVHGHDSWFCSGGMPETLDAIRRGDTVFTDSPVFRILLDCKLMTIAAMQGHALGGGLTFGLYADVVLMAEHAYYAGNFMAHGFTPGVGATFMFPRKFGPVLGTEMLYTARRYRGSEIKERGCPMEILKAGEVIPRALAIAQDLADKPLLQLKLLKQRLTEEIRRGVEDAIEKELTMHQLIFRTQP